MATKPVESTTPWLKRHQCEVEHGIAAAWKKDRDVLLKFQQRFGTGCLHFWTIADIAGYEGFRGCHVISWTV
jgi:hypothetical protein